MTGADLAKAVKRAYRAGRRAMTEAAEQDTRARLHEWRKQVKYFADELKSLSPVMRKGMGKTHRKSHRLADYLGDDHDWRGRAAQHKVAPKAQHLGPFSCLGYVEIGLPPLLKTL